MLRAFLRFSTSVVMPEVLQIGWNVRTMSKLGLECFHIHSLGTFRHNALLDQAASTNRFGMLQVSFQCLVSLQIVNVCRNVRPEL